IESLKLHIDDQQPVILLVEKGVWKVSVPHYYVAYGYNDEKRVILLHTGFESEQEISFDK
ncbi:MAG: peptidase C39, partial [Thermodesulfobacteriota bacterium]